MSTPTPETLRALAKRLHETFDPGGSLDPDGPDEWVLDHLLALDYLDDLLDSAREEKTAAVPVPDVQGPDGVCWKQGPVMHRCTYPKGHEGQHQWEQDREETTDGRQQQ